MSDFFDKFIADLVKGASNNLRENGGPGVNIVVSRENRGREEKLANAAGLGALLGGAVAPRLSLSGPSGAILGAGLGADPGHGLSAALGAGAGGTAASMATGGLARLLHMNPEAAKAITELAGTGGAALGGHMAGHDKNATLSAYGTDRGNGLRGAFNDGAKSAAKAFGVFGIKEAFLPILGAIAGPTLARLGLGRLAAGAGGRALGGLAGKVAPRVAGGLGGAAFDQAAGMAGGALGQKLMPQQPQPQPMMG